MTSNQRPPIGGRREEGGGRREEGGWELEGSTTYTTINVFSMYYFKLA